MTMVRTFQQFFTPSKYSQVMIDALDLNSPKKIIDLAMGEGSLLIEAKKRWENASIYGNDIDPNCCNLINQEYPNIHCYNYDIFKNVSITKLLQRIGKVDLCVANPPFHLIPQDNDIRKLLKEFALDKSYKSEYIPSEVPFILQSIKVLNENGTLAIILPDGFFTNEYLQKFRQFLIETYSIQEVIELPKKIFAKTQAKTHILFLKNTKPLLSTIKLSHIENTSITIKAFDAIKRMDYSYHKYNQVKHKGKCLTDYNITLIRGKPKFLIEGVEKRHILHTTNFKKGNLFSNQLKTMNKLKRYSNQIAIPGDIILSRVGTACLGNVGIVEKGFFVITDCIFILRIEDKKLRKIILNSLNSIHGQNWIQNHSKGVGARHITLEEIKKFPIQLDN